ncbi:MAG: DUF2177 family protein [Bacillota bacterium]|nr:DUF2177 family protein [Bacillota bacterium]
MDYIKMYLITLAVFFVIDLTWLGLIAKNLYSQQLGFIMKENVNWVAAITFYLIFIIGIVYFVVNPAIINDNWRYALFAGMLFGFITYATYDLTNLATLKDWPLKITIIDLIWGTSLGGLTSIISFYIYRKIM